MVLRGTLSRRTDVQLPYPALAAAMKNAKSGIKIIIQSVAR